jgi:putative transcriptional regulator
MIGISEQNLSVLRSGRARGIRFGTLDAICKALGCQPGELLEYTDDPAT